MNPSAESSKLIELRAKTDRQLTTLVTRMLDRALSCDGWVLAHEVYAEASALFSTVRYVSRSERRRLESKFSQLRQLMGARVKAAC